MAAHLALVPESPSAYGRLASSSAVPDRVEPDDRQGRSHRTDLEFKPVPAGERRASRNLYARKGQCTLAEACSFDYIKSYPAGVEAPSHFPCKHPSCEDEENPVGLECVEIEAVIKKGAPSLRQAHLCRWRYPRVCRSLVGRLRPH